MKKTIAFVSAVCIIAIFCTRVDGLKCYECNSRNDCRCENLKGLDGFKTECPSESIGNKSVAPMMCRKIVQTVDYNLGELQSNTRIIRGCGYVDSNYTGGCYQRSGFGGRQLVCSCTTDLCNSSPDNYPSIKLITSLFTLLTTLFIFS